MKAFNKSAILFSAMILVLPAASAYISNAVVTQISEYSDTNFENAQKNAADVTLDKTYPVLQKLGATLVVEAVKLEK